MQKNKLLLLFPDGVGIRNYLYSNVFQNVKEDLVLLHNFDQETIEILKEKVSLSETIEIPVYKESVKEKFLRELICLVRLHYNAKKVGNSSLLTNWNWKQKTLSKKVFYKIIEANFIIKKGFIYINKKVALVNKLININDVIQKKPNKQINCQNKFV